MTTVAVDAGGADRGPREVALGAAQAAQRGIRVLLFGPADAIGQAGPGVEVVDAPVSIAKAPDPAFAVRTTPEASIVQAARAVAEGRAQALVSGGSTGSALAAALFNLRRDRGIYRPALALPLPLPGRAPVLLLDVGANVTCRPEHMIQFAHMGSAFAQAVMGISSPRVALLSNGEEPGKGTPELVSVHEQLAGPAGAGLNFIGNIEGTQLPEGVTDVLVMDGFTGNVTLKLTEGVSMGTLRAVRNAAMSSWRGRLGGLLLSSSVKALRDHIDPEAQGGAYMLGLRHVGVVAHGRFSQRGFARAIEVAARAVQEDVIGRTRSALAEAGALRPPATGPSGAVSPTEPGGGEPGGEGAGGYGSAGGEPGGEGAGERSSGGAGVSDGSASESAATVSGE